MPEIRAIETTYAGVRFRSRLEARWAVFFDVLNVPWEYEPEGFELLGGVRYLPDFLIEVKHRDLLLDRYVDKPGWVYAEVKPTSALDWRKTDLFGAVGNKILRLDGPPRGRGSWSMSYLRGQERGWWFPDQTCGAASVDTAVTAALSHRFGT